jgi:hypothetical protein
MQRVAAKKQSREAERVIPSTEESCMQLVVYQGYQGQNDSAIPLEPEAVTSEPTIIEEDEAVPINESNSNDEDIDDMYQIQHDPRLGVPISSYDVNNQDSVRRAYIVLGPCRSKMKQNNFLQHECGGMRRFYVDGLMNSSGWSIVLRKMLHIALFATCSKIATNLLVEVHL